MSTLDVRRRQILEAIIHCHTLTAQPVGSRVIAKRYNLGLSAATIRNAMADLEEMGYVMQPHTSAGRVPTELGYRFYVDSLMEVGILSEAEKIKIRLSYDDVRREFEYLMEQTSRILSTISHYVGVVMSPGLQTRVLKHFEIFQVSEDKLLAVLVVEPGVIRNRVLEKEETLTGEDLAKINNALKARFVGRSLIELQNLVDSPEQMRSMFDQQIFQEVSSLVRDALDVTYDPEIYLQGRSNIFSQPEFEDLRRMEAILDILEKKEQLSHLLDFSPGMEMGVYVRIGSEINCEAMEQCSVISAAYQWNQRPFGIIGVIGPTRMEYPRIVSIVDYTAKVMSQMLQNRLV